MVDLEHLARCLSYDRAQARAALIEFAALPESAQRDWLGWTDRAGLSLHFWRAAQESGISLLLDDEYRERRRKNAIRLTKFRAIAGRLAGLLEAAGLRLAVLKGFLLAPDYVPVAEDRLQNDIDFLLSPADAQKAFTLLLANGYRALEGEPEGPAVHLPMLLPLDFTHRDGDFFNPRTPPVVELHDRQWPSEFERIAVEFSPDPLTRVTLCEGLPALDARDQLSACVLHAMRHIFRGSLRPSNLYEIAGFLDRHVEDSSFWRGWLADNTQPPQKPLRELCVTGLAIAARVFHAPWPATLDAARASLPPRALEWIDRHSLTTMDSGRRGKEQLLLQLAFVPKWRDRVVVLQRRLAPLHVPRENLPRRAAFHLVSFVKFLRMTVKP